MTLAEYVSTHGPFAWPEFDGISGQIAVELSEVHQGGGAHGALNPEHIRVRCEQAKWHTELLAADKTGSQSSAGQSDEYQAPEHLDAASPVKDRQLADVYAFGRLCCFALFGVPDIDEPLLDRLPGYAAQLFRQCLELDPHERPTAAELRQKLDRSALLAQLNSNIAPSPLIEILFKADPQSRWHQQVVHTGRAVLGRSPDCDVVIDSVMVSRRHAEIRWEFDRLYIEDLGSKCGTQVRGQNIDRPTQLEDRDAVVLGNVEVHVSVNSLPSASHASADDERPYVAAPEPRSEAYPEEDEARPAAVPSEVPTGSEPDDHGEKPVYLDENVQFTVYRPRSVVPQKWFPLLAFAHLSDKPFDAAEDEPDPVEEVQRQAQRLLGEQADDFQNVTQDSLQAVPREGELTLVPQMPGVEFNPPSRTFVWQESVHSEQFRLRAGAELVGKTVRGRLTVFLGSIILADVPLSIQVAEREQSRARPTVAESARPYRRIFASYSHSDMPIVLQFERYVETLGDDYLRDWKHLRSGQQWNQELMDMIGRADLFQLFWSSNSMRSKYCRSEWEYAISLNRPNFIRPTYWEAPFPEMPDEDLPPEPLRRLHFQQIHFGAAETKPTVESPSPANPPSSHPELRPKPGTRLNRVRQPPNSSVADADFDRVKTELQQQLIANLDLSVTSSMDESQLRREVRMAAEELLRLRGDLLPLSDRERVLEEVLDEVFGFGPLEGLLQDATIGSILINGPKNISVERDGSIEQVDVVFRDHEHLVQIIERILGKDGRRLEEKHPMADARLPDGSRVSVIMPPLAPDGPCLAIRRTASKMLTWDNLQASGMLTDSMARCLAAAVEARLNIVLCGGPRAGKTTLLNALAEFIPTAQRIVTIENSPELRLPQDDIVRLLTRSKTLDGLGEITAVDLLRQSFTLQPARIIVGELRGVEAAELLQSMSGGQPGSLATIDAFSPSKAAGRLETLLMSADPHLSRSAIHQQIADAIDLLVHVELSPDGRRYVSHMTEVVGVEDQSLVLGDIFRQMANVGSDGVASNRLETTDRYPTLLRRLNLSDNDGPAAR